MADPLPWLVGRASLEMAMAAAGEPHAVGLTHGTMRMLLYAPRGTDLQQPHRKDELYIVASGSAEFIRDGAGVPVFQGDTLFVPSGMPHHFEAMSDDFTAWVVFWGPDGGEGD